MATGPVRQHYARAAGDPSHMGYGEETISGSNNGGSMSKHGGHAKATNHNMDGSIKNHHDTHKSHGFGHGVNHVKSAGVPHEPKEDSHGPSNTQFGDSMPGRGGSTLKQGW